jgi:hypothetical protein
MVVVYNNGTRIADSSIDSNKNNNMESFNKLKSFQNAKYGETGVLTEKVTHSYTSITTMEKECGQHEIMEML